MVVLKAQIPGRSQTASADAYAKDGQRSLDTEVHTELRELIQLSHCICQGVRRTYQRALTHSINH